MKKKLILDVHERPTVGKWIILALQHVFAMFGATVLVPILVNSAAGAEVLSTPVALVAAGIGTLAYILCTKGKSPMFLGGSFAYITPVVAAYAIGGQAAAFTAIMVVGLIYVLIGIIIKFTGKDWIDKLLPPIVIGPMIMIIGLGLASTAVNQIGIGEEQASWQHILTAVVAFLATGIFALRGKGILKAVPILGGIVIGYIFACIVGIVDFTPVMEAAWFSMPSFVIPFVSYTPNFVAVLSIVPIGIVTLAEHVGQHSVLGTVIDKNLLKEPGLDKTVIGDGVATFISAFLGNSDTTTYGENVSVVGMTKVASVWAVGLGAVFSIVIAFFAKFTALISTIPSSVLGGIAIILFGFIASNGVKILVDNKIDFGNTKNIIVASTMLILGMGGATISAMFGDIVITISGMSLAAIIGILLNVCLPKEKEVQLDDEENEEDVKSK